MQAKNALICVMLAVLVAGCTQTGTGGLTTSEIADITAAEDNVVRYTDDGFSPRQITIEQGETVTWVSAGPEMWVASASHPTHADYGLDHHSDPVFDQKEAGSVYRFTFNRTGEWQYHNHENGYHYGTVTVEQNQ